MIYYRHQNKTWKHLLTGFFILVIVVGGAAYWKRQAITAKYVDLTRPTPPPAVEALPESPKPTTPTAKTPPVQVEPVSNLLPKSFNLAAPFTSQAPFANWDEVHEETCEEAAVLMAHMFYKKLSLTPEEVEAELLDLVELQKKLLGYFEDTTAAETGSFAKKAYKFSKSRILEKPTVEEIKRELFARRPVILPVNGKLLKNPNFKNGGPSYHMIVVRGWNEKGFFTNDPGTRKGENYFYTYDTINEAMHDWDGNHDGAMGAKRALVLYP